MHGDLLSCGEAPSHIHLVPADPGRVRAAPDSTHTATVKPPNAQPTNIPALGRLEEEGTRSAAEGRWRGGDGMLSEQDGWGGKLMELCESDSNMAIETANTSQALLADFSIVFAEDKRVHEWQTVVGELLAKEQHGQLHR